MKPRILVAGVGNIFFGDDAFGVEVVRALAAQPVPDGVKIEDFGIRGMHLAYEIVAGYDAVIFVDAIAPRGGAPGTLHLLEPDASAPGVAPDAHSMELDNVFAFVRTLGGSGAAFYLVGCEPAGIDEGIGLSAGVAAAVPAAASMVSDLVRKLVLTEATA